MTTPVVAARLTTASTAVSRRWTQGLAHGPQATMSAIRKPSLSDHAEPFDDRPACLCLCETTT
ncbi:DUF802 domain-containing protein [Bradyrhizobium elkanii]